MAAVCHEGDAIGTEGRGVCETNAGILRALARRPVNPDQSWLPGGMALSHLQDDYRQLDDVRRWYLLHPTAAGIDVRGKISCTREIRYGDLSCARRCDHRADCIMIIFGKYTWEVTKLINDT